MGVLNECSYYLIIPEVNQINHFHLINYPFSVVCFKNRFKLYPGITRALNEHLRTTKLKTKIKKSEPHQIENKNESCPCSLFSRNEKKGNFTSAVKQPVILPLMIRNHFTLTSLALQFHEGLCGRSPSFLLHEEAAVM